MEEKLKYIIEDGYLLSQFSSVCNDNALNAIALRVQTVQHGEHEYGSLPGTGFGLANQLFTLEGIGQGFGLHYKKCTSQTNTSCWMLKTSFLDCPKQFLLQAEVFELGDIVVHEFALAMVKKFLNS